MAKVKTVKEIVFDMTFENMSVMDMLISYNDVTKTSKLPIFKYNTLPNITEDIDEDNYSKEEPLITIENGKVVSKTNIEFVSKYFTKALKHILKKFDLYEDPDYVIFEQFIQSVISRSGKLRKHKIEDIVDLVLDKDLNILMDGNITTEMLLENILENECNL